MKEEGAMRRSTAAPQKEMMAFKKSKKKESTLQKNFDDEDDCEELADSLPAYAEKAKNSWGGAPKMEQKEAPPMSLAGAGMLPPPLPAPKAQDFAFMNKVINSQSSEGFWSDESLLTQVASLSGDATLTLEKVREALKTEVKPESLTKVVLTILALWVLSKKFEDKEDEWQMIARKAKNYLKAHGIQKLEPIYQRLFPEQE